jgi:hypothetical protein
VNVLDDAPQKSVKIRGFERIARYFAHHLHQPRALLELLVSRRAGDGAGNLIRDRVQERELTVESSEARALDVENTDERFVVPDRDADLGKDSRRGVDEIRVKAHIVDQNCVLRGGHFPDHPSPERSRVADVHFRRQRRGQSLTREGGAVRIRHDEGDQLVSEVGREGVGDPLNHRAQFEIERGNARELIERREFTGVRISRRSGGMGIDPGCCRAWRAHVCGTSILSRFVPRTSLAELNRSVSSSAH